MRQKLRLGNTKLGVQIFVRKLLTEAASLS